MATSAEITIGGIALFVYTIIVITFYYVGNAVLAPLLEIAAKWNIHPSLQASMWETSYIYSTFFSILLILWVIAVIGFVAILARRQVSPFDY